MLKRNIQLCDIENKRVPVETILSSCLKYVCHVLLTNSSLEVIWIY